MTRAFERVEVEVAENRAGQSTVFPAMFFVPTSKRGVLVTLNNCHGNNPFFF
jgi:hypothetical protein